MAGWISRMHGRRRMRGFGKRVSAKLAPRRARDPPPPASLLRAATAFDSAFPRQQLLYSVGPWGVCLARRAQRADLYQDKHTSHGHSPYGFAFICPWLLLFVFLNRTLGSTIFLLFTMLYQGKYTSHGDSPCFTILNSYLSR